MTPRQKDYAIASGYDEDYVFTPRDEDIINGKLSYPWRINHSSDTPTHELRYDPTICDKYPHGRPYLTPKRVVSVGEEITFNYNNF